MKISKSKDDILSFLSTEVDFQNPSAPFIAFANLSPSGICICDESHIFYVNDAMLSLSGRDRAEVLAWSPESALDELLSAEDREAHFEALQFATAEVQIRSHDGSSRWVNFHTIPLSPGKPFPMAFLALDIEKHKSEHDFYQDSHVLIQRIAETSPHISYVYDIVQNFYVYANRRIQDLLGYTEAEVADMGKAFPMCLMHADDQLKRIASLKQWKNAPDLESWSEDFRLRDAQGDWRWVSLNESPFERDADGRVMQIIGSLQDITERKRHEEQLQHRLDFESLILDISGRFINLTSEDIDQHINNALREVAEFIGMESGHVCRFDESLRTRRITHLWRSKSLSHLPESFKETNTESMPWLLEQLKNNERVTLPSMSELPPEASKEKAVFEMLEVNAVVEVPLSYQGDLVGYLGFTATTPTGVWTSEELRLLSFLGRVIIDILMLKEAEVRRQELENQIRQSQKLESLGVLAGGISHDFNNILVPIIAFTDLSMHTLEESNPLYGHLNEVKKAGNRAKDLIRQIMAFSRQSGTERHALNPVHVVKETLPLLRSSLPSTIDIKESIVPNSGFIYANPSELHRILMNLSTNAFHAMEENGGTLSIQLDSVVVDDALAESRPNLKVGQRYVMLTVSDTGTGIDSEIVSRIFDPFFSTKDDDKGTGLGLAAVHGLVQELNGDIVVKTALDEGTTFQVFIPEYREETSKLVEPEAPSVVGRGEHILIVDDELNILKVEESVLLSSGYRTSAFSDSTEAFNAFRNNPNDFDVILADQTMPRLTGLKLASDIRKIRDDIPIILCSGMLDDFTFKQTQVLKRCYVVHKPFTSTELAKTVRVALDSKDS